MVLRAWCLCRAVSCCVPSHYVKPPGRDRRAPGRGEALRVARPGRARRPRSTTAPSRTSSTGCAPPSTWTRAATAARRRSPGCTTSVGRRGGWSCCTWTVPATCCPGAGRRGGCRRASGRGGDERRPAPRARSDRARGGSAGSPGGRTGVGGLRRRRRRRGPDRAGRRIRGVGRPPGPARAGHPRDRWSVRRRRADFPHGIVGSTRASHQPDGRLPVPLPARVRHVRLALIDAVRRPPQAFLDAGKRTKGFWSWCWLRRLAVAFVAIPSPLGMGGCHSLRWRAPGRVGGLSRRRATRGVRYSGGGRGRPGAIGAPVAAGCLTVRRRPARRPGGVRAPSGTLSLLGPDGGRGWRSATRGSTIWPRSARQTGPGGRDAARRARPG